MAISTREDHVAPYNNQVLVLRTALYLCPLNSTSKNLSVCLFIVGKAFAAATAIVFGGATFLFVYAAYKLELHTVSFHTDF